jgi:membrane protein DedA with SNARE-associated domain/rhodanese-related sulfurtransferase
LTAHWPDAVNGALAGHFFGGANMESWISGLAQHGYAILFAIVFLESVGFPLPAALALLIAGAAAARGALQVPFAAVGALVAMLAGDSLMYLLGRTTGWWLLGVLCRVSLNPEACVLRSADSFYRRGRKLLVVAKFIPGINTMAPPLAGSMQMRYLSFLRLDLAGAALYVGCYFGIGFVFSGALQAVTQGYRAFGRVMSSIVIALVAVYLAVQVWLWIKERAQPPVAFAVPLEAADGSLAGAQIYDVRSHGYFEANAVRIKGSKRLDPHALHQDNADFEERVYLYCTCAREATSRRVARELEIKLHGKGVRIAVIRGGLRAWRKAGLPIEGVPRDDMAALPVFD